MSITEMEACDWWPLGYKQTLLLLMQVAECVSYYKCSSGWQAICVRYSYNSRTRFQLTQRCMVCRRYLSLLLSCYKSKSSWWLEYLN